MSFSQFKRGFFDYANVEFSDRLSIVLGRTQFVGSGFFEDSEFVLRLEGFENKFFQIWD